MNKPNKYIPTRMCCACRTHGEKDKFIKLVKTPLGIKIAQNNQQGRGCYICKNVECVALAQKKHALERSFKTQVNAETYEELMELIHRGA